MNGRSKFLSPIPRTGRIAHNANHETIGEMETIICRELGVWMRNPEGVWDWLGRGRIGLKNLGRLLTNREMSNYFREAIVVKSRKLFGVVERHCVALEFTTQMGESEDEQFQDNFGKCMGSIDEYLNTDSIVGQFGETDVYDRAKINSRNISRIPGSRAKGKCNAREEKGKGR